MKAPTDPRCTATCLTGRQCTHGALSGRWPRQCRVHLLRSERAGLYSIKNWRPAHIDESDPHWQRHMKYVADCIRRGVPAFRGPRPSRCAA